MPIYKYIAFDLKGKEHKGILDAASPPSARKALRSRGLYLKK